MIITKLPATLLPLLLLVSLALTGCDATDSTSKTAGSTPLHQVEVKPASLQLVSLQQTMTGTLEASTIVHLHNEVSGRITSLPFYEGDTVAQGETLIKLDDTLLVAELEKATALKKQATLDLARLKKLIPNKLASEEDITSARTELDIATAEEKLQQTLLAKSVLRAPFSGTITERNYEPGDVVAEHSHILTMIDPASLHIKLPLSESWLPLVELNGIVDISIDALGNTVYQGKITRIHPTIDPGTRKGIVEVTFDPQPAGARAGQLARIKIQSIPGERLLVLSHSVRHDSRGAHVFVVGEDNKVSKIYVRKGLQFGDQIEITEGLFASQNVIIRGFTALRDGITVEIVVPKESQ